jgi:DNA-binding transcriptional ArsR family regulator
MAGLKGKKLKQVIDPILAKVFTHPLRGHIWVTLFERGIVSPAEIAHELELEANEVSYHFRSLSRKGLIKLARTVSRRGFNEHFYEPVPPVFRFEDEDWMKLPAGVRSSLSGETVQQVIQQLIEALETGSFDARNRHLSQTWLLLDERGWKEVILIARRALERVLAVQERFQERREDSSEPGIPVAVVMAVFETAASIAAREAGKTKGL